MSDEPGWKLTFAFPDQSPQFAHGFACGRLWQQMIAPGACVIDCTMLAETRETIEGMAMALGWIEQFEELECGWLNVTLTKPDGGGCHDPVAPIVPELGSLPR